MAKRPLPGRRLGILDTGSSSKISLRRQCHDRLSIPRRPHASQSQSDESTIGRDQKRWRDLYVERLAERLQQVSHSKNGGDYLATERLNRAGLGPAALGICVAHSLISDTGQDSGPGF